MNVPAQKDPQTCALGSRLEIIPSLDLLDGNVVRLRRGSFSDVTTYGDPQSVLEGLDIPRGARLHVVDLEGSRSGRPVELELVRGLAKRGYRIQVGGGVRTAHDARAWVDAGAWKLVVGTMAAAGKNELERIVDRVGRDRVIPAVDLRNGRIRVAGWTAESDRDLTGVLRELEQLGFEQLLVTDIGRDGMMQGPSIDLYARLAGITSLPLLASGGVATVGDLVTLARMDNIRGAIVGRALLDGRISYSRSVARVAMDSAPERVIPCLDIRDGRVVKGVRFEGVRDAGDPVECARRYEQEGADELVILDIGATPAGRGAALQTVRSVADAIFIPVTVGGGVRSIDDFRALLQSGADRVAINSAAVADPALIGRCAHEFGRQAVVIACDAKRRGDGFEVMVNGGREETGIDVIAWCREAESRGAGEILLTSVDRDGTREGFDVDLLRAVTSAVSIGVIASGGAGAVVHFAEAIERGGARAVLAASLFHDGVIAVKEVKEAFAAAAIPVRSISGVRT